MMIPTPYLIGGIALASVLVGIGVQRLVASYASRRLEEGTADIEKPMTYSEAMANLAKVGPAETSRKRRLKKRKKPELVTLSMLRYGEYSTDDSKLTIQAWRPDPNHRLAGHVVVDIIPKPSEDATMTLSSVRRLAIDLETVDAARVVKLADGEAIVLAVSDYEVKGQGVIFKDLDYAQGVGVDSTTLYIVLVIKNVVGIAPQADELRQREFRNLARGLDFPPPPPPKKPTKKVSDDVAAPESSRPEPEKIPLVGNEVGRPAAGNSDEDRGIHNLPDTTVSHFFHHTFRSVF